MLRGERIGRELGQWLLQSRSLNGPVETTQSVEAAKSTAASAQSRTEDHEPQQKLRQYASGLDPIRACNAFHQRAKFSVTRTTASVFAVKENPPCKWQQHIVAPASASYRAVGSLSSVPPTTGRGSAPAPRPRTPILAPPLSLSWRISKFARTSHENVGRFIAAKKSRCRGDVVFDAQTIPTDSRTCSVRGLPSSPARPQS